MLSDLRFAFRALRQHRLFALVAVLSIALGIGANAVIFSLADAVLLRPIPVPAPEQVVNLRFQLRGQPLTGVSYPDYVDFRAKTKAFSGLTASDLKQFAFAPDRRAQADAIAGLLVSGDFFDVLQVSPRLGRGFRADEVSTPGRDAVAVISYDLWRRQFSSSPDVVGRTVLINGIAFKIVGVAPQEFTGLDQYFRPDLFIPMMMKSRLAGDPTEDWLQNRADRSLTVKGRLRNGVSVDEAAAEAQVIAGGLAKAYPDTNRDWSATVRTELQARIDMSPYDALLVALLLGLASVVLLIACANVANLMLGRAVARSGEIAVRMALGAGRWRLVRQLLTESLLISLAAGAAGLVLAQACMETFLPWRIPSEIPMEIGARLDLRVALYALCAAVASAVLCGLVPAIRATGANIETALRAGGRNLEPRRRFLGRDALVVGQVAGSLFLLVCAAQLYHGISSVVSAPAGFRSDHVVMASFDPSLARYDEPQTRTFYRNLADRARELPGAVSAAVAELAPISNHPDMQPVVPEGFRLPPGRESVRVLANVVSEGYFSTLGIPILRGRAFRPTDTGDSPRVAVVNEQFAKSYFAGQDPVGRRFRLGGPDGSWVEIVGVAKSSKYSQLVEPPQSFVYLPFGQNYRARMTLFVQSAGPSESLAAPVRGLVRSLDANQPVLALRTMEGYVQDRATKVFHVLTGMMGGMGLLGLVLALSGLYAVMAWSVARRSREIGIRMAVGADRVAVLGMVLKQGILLSLVGIAIGLGLSLMFSRALTAGIGVPLFSAPVLVLVPLSLLAMAAAGAYLPARRASRLDPIAVLRQE